MSFCITLFDTLENSTTGDVCFGTSTKNLTLNKGSSYRIIFDLTKNGSAANLTGFSFRGQIRTSATSSSVLLEMNSANLLIKSEPTIGRFTVFLPESFTRRVSGSYAVYDIEMIDGLGDVSKIVQGLITFVSEVTQ
jgi:hypothetical protein